MSDTLQCFKELLDEVDNECICKKTKSTDLYEAAKPELLSMPVEIILKICTYLDPYFLKNTLSKVCKRFEAILADASLWEYWVHNKLSGCFPTLPQLKLWNEVDILWEDICIEMDLEQRKWSNVRDTMKHVVVKDIHFASVDTVLLINKGELCISGGRDRGMAVWNVLDIRLHNKNDSTTTLTDAAPQHICHDAHAGWVWDLAADNVDSASVVYSASWDNTVKAWDLGSGFTCKETFRCGMSALSVVTNENIVMAGLYSKKILSFDLRAGPYPIHSYKPHRGPVLALDTLNNKVASVSEDKTLAVWDRVAGKLLISDVKMPSDKAYPVCISWCPSTLYIGDSRGSLHLFNPEQYKFIKSHEIWPEPPIIKPSSKITGCCQSQANMIVCSDRGEIKFLYNCYPPEEYASVKTSTFDVTQLQYLNGVLVVGTCDSALEFWIPKERFHDL